MRFHGFVSLPFVCPPVPTFSFIRSKRAWRLERASGRRRRRCWGLGDGQVSTIATRLRMCFEECFRRTESSVLNIINFFSHRRCFVTALMGFQGLYYITKGQGRSCCAGAEFPYSRNSITFHCVRKELRKLLHRHSPDTFTTSPGLPHRENLILSLTFRGTGCGNV